MSKIILLALLCMAFINTISAFYVAVDLGECSSPCPDVINTVCGTDGETYKEFPNACEMGVSNCQLENDGLKPFVQTDSKWCSTTLIENLYETLDVMETGKYTCGRDCPVIYHPVCISNGEYHATITNECDLGYFNCLVESEESKEIFKVIKKDEC